MVGRFDIKRSHFNLLFVDIKLTFELSNSGKEYDFGRGMQLLLSRGEILDSSISKSCEYLSKFVPLVDQFLTYFLIYFHVTYERGMHREETTNRGFTSSIDKASIPYINTFNIGWWVGRLRGGGFGR